MSEPIEEPVCIHTGLGPRQPMSRCVVCCESPTLLRWVAYWQSAEGIARTPAHVLERPWANHPVASSGEGE